MNHFRFLDTGDLIYGDSLSISDRNMTFDRINKTSNYKKNITGSQTARNKSSIKSKERESHNNHHHSSRGHCK
jgi:hypothetical protein